MQIPSLSLQPLCGPETGIFQFAQRRLWPATDLDKNLSKISCFPQKEWDYSHLIILMLKGKGSSEKLSQILHNSDLETGPKREWDTQATDGK